MIKNMYKVNRILRSDIYYYTEFMSFRSLYELFFKFEDFV